MHIRLVTHLRLYFLLALCLCAASVIALDWANPVLVQAVSMGDGPGRVLMQQPYALKTGKGHPAMLLLKIHYTGGQNTHIIIEPDNGCVVHIFPSFANNRPLCDQSALDLAPFLKGGINQLVLQVASKEPVTQLYISPQLWGADGYSTLACAGIFMAAAALMFLIARCAGLDTVASAIAAMGLLYFALLLHYRPNLSYSNDYIGHIAYTRFMVDHWMHPYGYWGWEDFHPPLYYLIAARFFALGDISWIINPLTAVRLFALGLYMVFCVYGLRTLQEAVEKKGMVYYAGSLLLVFWPLNLIMATRINNDLAIYVTWSAAFYYLTRWYRDRDIAGLRLALVATGIAFMIKANAYLPAAIVGGCVLFALYDRRVAWHELWRPRNIPSCGVLLAGIAVSVSRAWYIGHYRPELNHLYFGRPSNDFRSWDYFIHFNLPNFIAPPDLQYDREPGYLDYFLKTTLYGEAHFPMLNGLASALNSMLVGILCLTVLGIVMHFIKTRRSFSDLFPYLLAIAVSIGGSITFMVLKDYIFCQDFRYVLPMLIPFIVLFMRGMDSMRAVPMMRPLYWIGIALSMALIADGGALYTAMYGIIKL